MSHGPRETNQVHTRLLKCALEIEDCRAYWQRIETSADLMTPDVVTSREAFDQYWFGARSLSRISVLLQNMRARFNAFPGALQVLSRWSDMDPDTRKVICHWHLQLTDPIYRDFTGCFLVARHENLRPEVTRDLVVSWVRDQGPDRWSMPTRIQLASKLLSAAFAADLVETNRDPRPLRFPRVSDDALTYLMYLLRDVTFAGTLLNNPYTASVGLERGLLEDRLRALPALEYRRQSDLIDVEWRYENLIDWAEANVARGVS